MFDKNLFDRNAYDRSVSSDGINGIIFATSSMRTQVVIAYPIPLRSLQGQGDLTPGLLLNTNVGIPMEGTSSFENTPIVLRMPIVCHMTSDGIININPTVKTPIRPVIFEGHGEFKSRSDYLLQNMIASLNGSGNMEGLLVIQTPLDIEKIEGLGDITGEMRLLLPIESDISSSSDLILRRLSALNESIFELENINLMPGESVTIDTDLLVVLFGYREDVSSVTTDSVFFELSPGENDITIETDSGGEMSVTAIWQNRWL